MLEKEVTTYKTILIRESDNRYFGFNPSKIGTGMKSVEWGKTLPDDIDGEDVVYIYDEETEELVKQ
jgi:hypothetical protein